MAAREFARGSARYARIEAVYPGYVPDLNPLTDVAITVEMLAKSLKTNVDDLAKYGDHNDVERAIAIDVLRHNAAVVVAVAMQLLNETDVTALGYAVTDTGRQRRAGRQPASTTDEYRELADRLRTRINAILADEPSLGEEARARIDDVRNKRSRSQQPPT